MPKSAGSHSGLHYRDRQPVRPFIHLFQGMTMGVADAIPGVSGGTMALINGIYDRLVGTISIGVDAILLVLSGRIGAGIKRLGDIAWLFFLPLLAGIGTAVFAASHVIPDLIATYPAYTSAVFFGLVAASLQAPYQEIGREMTPKDWVLMLIFALFAFWLVGLSQGAVVSAPGFFKIFMSAAIAITAMILPGISGAYLLLIMGMYAPTLTALKAMNLPYVLTFALGAVIGLGAFSKVLTWLLASHRATTMSALLGLMVGSLRSLWPFTSGMDLQSGAMTVAFMILGAGVVTFMMTLAKGR